MLHYQSTVTLPVDCYITNRLIHYQSTVTLPIDCYITNQLLHYQSTVTLPIDCYITNRLLHYRSTVTLPVDCFITGDCYITGRLLHYRSTVSLPATVTLPVDCYITGRLLHYQSTVTLPVDCYITCLVVPGVSDAHTRCRRRLTGTILAQYMDIALFHSSVAQVIRVRPTPATIHQVTVDQVGRSQWSRVLQIKRDEQVAPTQVTGVGYVGWIRRSWEYWGKENDLLRGQRGSKSIKVTTTHWRSCAQFHSRL